MTQRKNSKVVQSGAYISEKNNDFIRFKADQLGISKSGLVNLLINSHREADDL